MIRVLLSAAAVVVLAGCVPENSSPSADPGPAGPDQCGAVDLQNLVGRPVSDFEALQWTKHPARIVRPGEMVTLEYSASRLTIWTDEGDNISRLSCG